jgi:class 3 adenylate cyclase
MTRIAERTVVFADLRGSTSLFEKLGNAEATSIVTQTVSSMAGVITAAGGHVIKTLGDGLMAVFETPEQAVSAAHQMHEVLEELVARGRTVGASIGMRSLRVQVALARGEIVEMNGDCFGDAVNVAARLLDHAGDNETLITDGVFSGLAAAQQARFRSLDWMHLRGRAEPVLVHLMGGRRYSDTVVTQFGIVESSAEPDGIRLIWGPLNRLYSGSRLPVVLGRSPQSNFCVDDARVSRSHARIDSHGGTFTLSDLSYNGTYVRFASAGEVIALRRGQCTLHGSGVIGLGGSPLDPTSAIVEFEVLIVAETQPQDPMDLP